MLGPKTRRVSDPRKSLRTTPRFRGLLRDKKKRYFLWDALVFKKYKCYITFYTNLKGWEIKLDL